MDAEIVIIRVAMDDPIMAGLVSNHHEKYYQLHAVTRKFVLSTSPHEGVNILRAKLDSWLG